MHKSNHSIRFAVLAVDTVLFCIRDGVLQVLLIPVVIPQFKGKKGLPGGLIDSMETAEEAVRRHILEKGGIKSAYLEQLYTFSEVNRDPRGRVVSVAYIGCMPADKLFTLPEGVLWKPVNRVGELAYDHNDIVRTAHERLRARIGYTNIICNLLPKEFTLTQLQQAYETILGHSLDKRNFRKKILYELKLVKGTGKKQEGVKNRPAELYRFVSIDLEEAEIL
jgi:8-oxo-dGTP diphosphatase